MLFELTFDILIFILLRCFHKILIFARYMLLPGSHNRRTEKTELAKSSKEEKRKKISFSQGKISSFLKGHWNFKRKFGPALYVPWYMYLGFFWNFATFKEGWNFALRKTECWPVGNASKFHKTAKASVMIEPCDNRNNSDLLYMVLGFLTLFVFIWLWLFVEYQVFVYFLSFIIQQTNF